jgi:hypothetical protein
MARKGGDVTLSEHARRIGPLGGKARMEQMSDKERSEFGRIGGQAGGPARAKKLSAKRRKEIAQKAAIARWGGKNAD